MHLNSELLFKKYASQYFRENIKVLEIGSSGISNYQKLINKKFVSWNTLDIKSEKSNSLTNINHIESVNEYSYPIPDNYYDIILSGQVIEHVKEIWTWTKELNRITKKNGIVITISPISWPYHEAPVDCWRIYPEGLKSLFEQAEFKVLISTYECLELEYFNYSSKLLNIPNFTIASSSIADDNYKLSKTNKIKFHYNSILKNIPFFRRMMTPIRVSYDAITIAIKS